MKFAMLPQVWDTAATELSERGHSIVDKLDQAQALIYTSEDLSDFPELPDSIGWVQYAFTGVDKVLASGVVEQSGRPWANTAGAFAKPVAESALGLLLSAAHRHKAVALDGSFAHREEHDRRQKWLYDRQHIAVIGAGGIGQEFIRMVAPFEPYITAVNTTGNSVTGADRTVALDQAWDERVWHEADVVVLALPLTEQTRGVVDATVLAAMKSSALLINVGRGKLIVTDDLVAALRDGEIAGAGLEVTDPEPLADDHPLWTIPQCVITPHIAASAWVAEHHLAGIVDDNAAAFERGETMPTQIDPQRGY